MLHNRYVLLSAKILLGAAALLFTVFVIRKILPCVLPFLLAFATAALFEHPIAALCSRYRFRRGYASVFVLLLFFLAVLVLLSLAAAKIFEEIYGFFTDLPTLFAGVPKIVANLQDQIDQFLLSMPDGSRSYVEELIASIGTKIAELPGTLSEKALTGLSRFAVSAPDVLLFVATYVVGSFLISLGYPEIKSFLKRQLSPGQLEKAAMLKADFTVNFLHWLKAQLLLMLITFSELSIALTLLGVPYSLLSAMAISLIDALPVFGVGTILIPWSIYCLFTGNVPLGLGLVATYLVISFVRSLLEPKLVGRQIGLHPAATLAAIYLGYKLFGVFGIIFAPLVLIMVKQLNDKKYIRLWK